MKGFASLKRFAYVHSGLSLLEEDIPWSASVTEIDLRNNYDITEIPPNAFRTASGLEQLDMSSMGPELAIKEDGFHITSRKGPSLRFYQTLGCVTDIAPNTFGNVAGGALWGNLWLDWCDFPEDVFRVMLKSAFDKGQECKYGEFLMFVR